MSRTWTLLGPDGEPWSSDRPGALGGNRGTRVYGRLDCPVALAAIARGREMRNRVFFLDESHARAAGYRPCGACMRAEYRRWKQAGGPTPR